MYNIYILTLITIGYSFSELGRYLIGSTSKAIAKDLHYGEKSCQLNHSKVLHSINIPIRCDKIEDMLSCTSVKFNGTYYCEWNFNGLGIEYQILAGPAFIAVYTVAGIFMGIVADRYNRTKLLATCTCFISIAITTIGMVNEYWQLVILRMIMAIGEAGYLPLATGIISDVFTVERRGLAISIFNWGIIIGYGFAFPVGKYIPGFNLWNQGWRVAYYFIGLSMGVLALFILTTLKEPPKKVIGEEIDNNQLSDDVTIWKTFKQLRMILFCSAASLRLCAGLCLIYNMDMYFGEYFPEVDLSWWLFSITLASGMLGMMAGGILSDKFVKKMGIRSRVAVLGISQLIATVPAFGVILFEPLWAMVSYGISFFFGVMWFGILFTVIVEIVPLKLRSTTLAIFVFIMTNIGGNLPIVVEPVSKVIGYRNAIMIFYGGGFASGALLFCLMIFVIEKPQKKPTVENIGRDNFSFSDNFLEKMLN